MTSSRSTAPPLVVAASVAAWVLLPLMALSCKSRSAPPGPPLSSAVHRWDDLPVEDTGKGQRRPVLDGPTKTLDRLHSHVTTLNPGEISGEPRLHLQEEVIIVKEGSVEAYFDGETKRADAGSTIFFASGAVTALRNVGEGPATYQVIYYYTPLTPRAE